MKTTKYAGIDYSGSGSLANRDSGTGIRYGIIPAHAVGQAWYDGSEPDYGEPHCPKCGNEVAAPKSGKSDYWCPNCRVGFESGECFPDESLGSTYDRDGVKAREDSGGEVWVFASPYFTYAQFCSPCAPGACHLGNPLAGRPEANRCYCLGHDWFESGVAPYAVYAVATGEEIGGAK